MGVVRTGRCIALATTGIALLACGAELPLDSPPRPVRALVVPHSGEVERPSFPGRAQAVQELELGFEVAGRMLERPAGLGDRVEKGQPLAQLDRRDFRSAFARARAVRERTVTRLARVREAAESGSVSEQEVDEAEAQAETATAEVEIRRKALADTTLRAPFDGIVAATYVEPLQEVKDGEPILRLLDTSQIEMWVRVPENRIDRARSIEEVTVSFDALPGREFSARIVEIGGEADDQTRTFPVNLRIEQPAGAGEEVRILPGMAGEASAQLSDDVTGPELPLSAVFSDATSGSYVWVVDSSGTAVERRAVETGRLSDSGIEIRRGLEPGEKVVTKGSQFLSDGLEVRVLEPDEGAS